MNLEIDTPTYAALLLFASLGLGGCAGQATSQETTDTHESPLVAQVEVGYGYIAFYETRDMDDNVLITVAEVAPNDYASTPFASISSGHTALELFRAVAPEREVPAVLLETHELDVLRLGRLSSEVMVPVFDRDAPIEKTSQACKNFVTPSFQCVGYSAVADRNVSSGTRSLYLNNSSSYYSFSGINMGFCNESDETIYSRYSYGFRGESLNHFLTASVPGGSKMLLPSINKSRAHFCSTGLCGDARYRVRGITADAGAYGMRLAEVYDTCVQ